MNDTTQTRWISAVSTQTAGALYNAAVSFALTAWLARAMGTADFGNYIAVLGFATLALIVIEGGWPTFLYRESVPGAGFDAARVARLERAAFAHALLAGLVLVALALLLPLPALPAALACMTLVAAMNVVSARLRGAGRFGAEARWQVAGRTVSAVCIVLAVSWFGAAPQGIFLAWAAGLLLVLAAGALRQPPSLPALAARGWYALAVPFLLSDGFAALAFKSDVALSKLFGLAPDALSHYAACTRLNEAALLLCAPLANVTLRATRLRDDANARARLVHRTLVGAAFAGVLACAASIVLGGPLMRMIFGAAFEPAGDLLPWTAAALVFALPNLVAIQALLAQDGERRVVRALAIAGVVLVASLAAGIATNGARGAAVGFALAHATLLAMLLHALRPRLGRA